MTDGSGIVVVGERTLTSYSESTYTASRITARTVSCHDQSDSGTSVQQREAER